jgi:hypothetical protein
MAKTSKKVIKEIRSVSCFTDVLEEKSRNRDCVEHFWHSAPDTWNKQDTELWDMLTNLETTIKEKIIEVLSR